MHKRIFFISFALASILTHKSFAGALLTHAYVPNPANAKEPWFTGSLLAPGAHTTGPKHVYMEPYFLFTTFTGRYDKNGKVKSIPNFYSLNSQYDLSIGLNSFLDFGIAPQFYYQFTEGQRAVEFGDLPAGFNIQLLNESTEGWIPAIRLSLKTIIPTGKYNNLDPQKLYTQASGLGSWIPYCTLSAGRIILLSNGHFISPKLAAGILVPTGVSVKNFNTYGGGEGTRGTVYPGNNFWVNAGVEYNFTQQFGFALDIFYDYENKTRFSGNPGAIAPGIPASIRRPSFERWSLAPALEYNWSQNIGLIGGVWVTVAGRNSYQFISGILALSVYL